MADEKKEKAAKTPEKRDVVALAERALEEVAEGPLHSKDFIEAVGKLPGEKPLTEQEEHRLYLLMKGNPTFVRTSETKPIYDLKSKNPSGRPWRKGSQAEKDAKEEEKRAAAEAKKPRAKAAPKAVEPEPEPAHPEHELVGAGAE